MKLTPTSVSWMLAALLCLAPLQTPVACQEQASEEQANEAEGLPPPPGLMRLAKDSDVWIDFKRTLVVVDGEVALRSGQLEMFACPKGTKVHESVIATPAFLKPDCEVRQSEVFGHN